MFKKHKLKTFATRRIKYYRIRFSTDYGRTYKPMYLAIRYDFTKELRNCMSKSVIQVEEPVNMAYLLDRSNCKEITKKEFYQNATADNLLQCENYAAVSLWNSGRN